MVQVIKLPIPTSQDADEQTRAETQRKHRLFAWADAVLKALRLDKAVADAESIEVLRCITLDANSAEVILAIRDALHPASGRRQEHFNGLKENGLKQILKNRLDALKKTREAKFGRRRRAADWAKRLTLGKDGKIVPNLANLILMLTEAPAWKGVLAYDEFSATVIIGRCPPPWGEEPAGTPWTDHFESLTRVWFQNAEINPSAGDVGRAVQAAAQYHVIHPVRDYFASLVWDGVHRLDTWLVTFFHAEDTPYIRAIGPRYLISAVARIFMPGAKVDHLPVFEEAQGKQKSEALRTLAIRDEWFTDRLSHVASKDAAMEMAGVLIVELAEMDAITKATSSAMKGFLSRRRDRFRPPYGRHTVNRPRQCVFAATINPPADGSGYLKDPTGARRFWPVACNGMVDLVGLEAARSQLWAEAVVRFKAGEFWWLPPELEALAAAEQARRFMVDPWEEPIRQWLGDRLDVSISQVLKHALGLAKARWPSAMKRIVGILTTRLGFKRCRPRTPNGREYRYRRDLPSPKKMTIPPGTT